MKLHAANICIFLMYMLFVLYLSTEPGAVLIIEYVAVVLILLANWKLSS